MKSPATWPFQNSYATRGGKIDPWGTIRILNRSVAEPSENEYKEWLNLQPGLKVWSEKLVQYGKGNYRVRVARNVVEVVAKDGSVVEKIPHSDFIVVYIHESYVHENGYLQYTLTLRHNHGDFLTTPTLTALDQVAKGEKPCFLDNSAFTQVDKKLAGQEVVELLCGGIDGKRDLVYSKEGERIPARSHYPLSYAKWAPTSDAARYSRVEATP